MGVWGIIPWGLASASVFAYLHLAQHEYMASVTSCASPANLCLHSVKYPQPCQQRVARHPQPMAAQCVLPSAWYATRSPCLQRLRHPRLGLHRVQQPQQLLALRHPQAATAPCVIPAASACNLYDTCSQCLHSVTCLQLLPATCATPATTGLQCVTPALGLQLVSGTNPGEAALLLDISTRLAVHLHAEVPNSMGCVTIVGLHMWTCIMAAAGPDQPTFT